MDDAHTDDYHRPVLVDAVRRVMDPHAGGTYVDMTVGGGGHSHMMLTGSTPDGRLLGLDRDPDALAQSAAVLAPFGDRATLAQATFLEAVPVAQSLGFIDVDGVLMDLGVSSHQLDTAGRGFSFRMDGPLDMRMSDSGPTAADLVNSTRIDELVRIFKEYGEERYARRIARAIVTDREKKPFTRTAPLAALIYRVVPADYRHGRIHPATRVFQALRMAVNDEMGMIDKGLDAAFSLLRPGGCLGVISFHSLEDRAVKRRFADWTRGCVCPPAFPVCQCNQAPLASHVERRGVTADEAEITANPRARSARLRAVRKQPEATS